MNSKIQRDINIIKIDKDRLLVIACDSSGGIGAKENDLVKASPDIVGSFTTRVALMEVMSVGANPISIVNTLSVEYDPDGKKILEGIRSEVEGTGLQRELIITGSTEENIKTSQTGVGVTVIAKVKRELLRIATSEVNDLIIAVGLPHVGKEVLLNQSKIADLRVLQQLLQINGIHEIIPVGSKGIAYEADVIANMSGLELKIYQNCNIDLYKSAGPSTTILASLPEYMIDEVRKKINIPVQIIAELV